MKDLLSKIATRSASRAALVSLLLFLLSGCFLDASTTRGDGTLVGEVDGPPLEHALSIGIVRLVNDPLSTTDWLDTEVGLDRRAAQRLVARRAGPDGLDGTADDRPFDSIRQVDATAYVGEQAMNRLARWAEELGYVPVLLLEGAWFTHWEVEDTLRLVNEAPQQVLDDDCGLDRRAAEGLVAGRPFDTLQDVAEVPFVSGSALNSLRVFASDGP